jgi:20S proteasome alpha/beta subunit
LLWFSPSPLLIETRETYLGMQCRLDELRNKQRISVAAASKILANIVYQYKGMGLSMVSLLSPLQEPKLTLRVP